MIALKGIITRDGEYFNFMSEFGWTLLFYSLCINIFYACVNKLLTAYVYDLIIIIFLNS